MDKDTNFKHINRTQNFDHDNTIQNSKQVDDSSGSHRWGTPYMQPTDQNWVNTNWVVNFLNLLY